jgi:hypothetical protein
MSSGVLVRQPLVRGESRRAASVLSRMQEVDGTSAVLHRLGVHLTEAVLGRSSDGPYVYYRIEPDRDGAVSGRYRAVVEAAADEPDAVAEVVSAYDRLAAGDPVTAEFAPVPDGVPEDSGTPTRNDSCPAED